MGATTEPPRECNLTAAKLTTYPNTAARWRDRNLDAGADVVGLYMNPPERAVVLSFDDKTQCQTLDRTQPSLPMTPDRGRAALDRVNEPATHH